MRAQTILFLLVDRVRGKLDSRPYRGGGEGNPTRLVEAASLAFSNRSNILTVRGQLPAACTAQAIFSPTHRAVGRAGRIQLQFSHGRYDDESGITCS